MGMLTPSDIFQREEQQRQQMLMQLAQPTGNRYTDIARGLGAIAMGLFAGGKSKGEELYGQYQQGYQDLSPEDQAMFADYATAKKPAEEAFKAGLFSQMTPELQSAVNREDIRRGITSLQDPKQLFSAAQKMYATDPQGAMELLNTGVAMQKLQQGTEGKFGTVQIPSGDKTLTYLTSNGVPTKLLATSPKWQDTAKTTAPKQVELVNSQGKSVLIDQFLGEDNQTYYKIPEFGMPVTTLQLQDYGYSKTTPAKPQMGTQQYWDASGKQRTIATKTTEEGTKFNYQGKWLTQQEFNDLGLETRQPTETSLQKGAGTLNGAKVVYDFDPKNAVWTIQGRQYKTRDLPSGFVLDNGQRPIDITLNAANESLKTYYEELPKYEESRIINQRLFNTLDKQLRLLSDPHTYTGAFADLRTSTAEMLVGLGASEESVRPLQNITNAQQFSAAASEIAVNVLAEQIKGTASERDLLEVKNVGAKMGNTIEANRMIIRFARNYHRSQMDRADKFINSPTEKYREALQYAKPPDVQFKMVKGQPQFFYEFRDNILNIQPRATDKAIRDAWGDL